MSTTGTPQPGELPDGTLTTDEGLQLRWQESFPTYYWYAKMRLLDHAREDVDPQKVLTTSVAMAGRRAYPREAFEQVWDVEAFATEHHCSETLLRIMEAYQGAPPERVWRHMATNHDVSRFVAHVAHHGWAGLAGSKGHPVAEAWFPGLVEAAKENADAAAMLKTIEMYTVRVARRHKHLEPYNAYKHGLRVSLDEWRIKINSEDPAGPSWAFRAISLIRPRRENKRHPDFPKPGLPLVPGGDVSFAWDNQTQRLTKPTDEQPGERRGNRPEWSLAWEPLEAERSRRIVYANTCLMEAIIACHTDGPQVLSFPPDLATIFDRTETDMTGGTYDFDVQGHASRRTRGDL